MSEFGGRKVVSATDNTVLEVPTSNANIKYRLKSLGDGSFYIAVFDGDKEHDYILYHEDEEHMTKLVKFMVHVYDEAFVDGKNHALMFMQ